MAKIKIPTSDGYMVKKKKAMIGNPDHPEGFGPIYEKGEKMPPMKKMVPEKKMPEKKKMPMPIPKKFKQRITNIRNLA